MRKQANTALYVGNGGIRQNDHLESHLQSIGIDLHTAFSMQEANRKLCVHKYSLLLIKYEHVHNRVFDLCRIVYQQNCKSVILVLMDKASPVIESTLFNFGVDDIAVGKQTLPSVLKFRIKKRLLNSRLPLPDINRILLKGGVDVILDRKEVWFNKSCHVMGCVIYNLFMYFVENPHRAISRTELIMSHIWENSVCAPSKEENGKAVDMAITRLRRIIEPNPSNPQIIITLHGTGWMLARDAVLLPSPKTVPHIVPELYNIKSDSL